ncbi:MULTISPECIES: (d)CMP kinase [Caloramator]|jgi:cytidylate kinase|uniref:Cytidylate kinase n=1 Tax=Caloramator australicus RC3 TaxID=857293 RepID=I7KU03_9CLOT|nr:MULTISPECIES: (d)CMP kinase [Caloramator]MDO6354445.1 (d)CMP kinase [Caloramator sp. CAR-1]CCJ33323.1 Cytidylate kinase [Caloramator australicus RC3]
MKKFSIAIDGPAGAGKSTIAKIIAQRLKIEYIDTGAMYRAITLKIIRNGTDINNIDEIIELLEKTDINFINGRVYLDGEDVSEEIRLPEIGKLVSQVAAIKEVREKLVAIQRDIAKNKSVIMDGRDIGTNVLKDAEIKIFLVASVEERAKRRYKELLEKGIEVSYDDIVKEIEKRDYIDSTREVNPLRKADDAIVVNNTNKTLEEVVEEILNIVCKKVEV